MTVKGGHRVTVTGMRKAWRGTRKDGEARFDVPKQM